MTTLKKPKRYTLTLPDNVHQELTEMANQKEISSKEVVIKCLKLGLIALSAENDPSKELLLRENIESNDVKETRLILI